MRSSGRCVFLEGRDDGHLLEMEDTMRNARFLVWLNDGIVKLTLRPGQKLSWGRGAPHEEGWSREYLSWEYDAELGVVVLEQAQEWSDCDGRGARYDSAECPLDRLASWEGTFPDKMPDWQRGEGSQRDWTAEAAGY